MPLGCGPLPAVAALLGEVRCFPSSLLAWFFLSMAGSQPEADAYGSPLPMGSTAAFIAGDGFMGGHTLSESSTSFLPTSVTFSFAL